MIYELQLLANTKSRIHPYVTIQFTLSRDITDLWSKWLHFYPSWLLLSYDLELTQFRGKLGTKGSNEWWQHSFLHCPLVNQYQSSDTTHKSEDFPRLCATSASSPLQYKFLGPWEFVADQLGSIPCSEIPSPFALYEQPLGQSLIRSKI